MAARRYPRYLIIFITLSILNDITIVCSIIYKITWDTSNFSRDFLILNCLTIYSKLYTWTIYLTYHTMSSKSEAALPALRRPKTIKRTEKSKMNAIQYVIVTLNDGKKLVVSSDSYHGLLTAGDIYRCVFCEFEMALEHVCKDRHKMSKDHQTVLENHPHIEEFRDNLIRKVADGYYCTICNVIVQSQFLMRHLVSEVHIEELQKAVSRAEAYTPY